VINLEFMLPDGDGLMAYDVHPRSQDEPIPIPAGAVSVTVWLGTTPGSGPDVTGG
jgi:hypothetical protein